MAPPTKRTAPASPEPEVSVASCGIVPRRTDGTRVPAKQRRIREKDVDRRARYETVYGEEFDGTKLRQFFERDGAVVLRDFANAMNSGLDAMQDECQAVLWNYAKRSGNKYPTRDCCNGRFKKTGSAPSDFSWMSKDFGCVFEIANACDCAPKKQGKQPRQPRPEDPRSFGHDHKRCRIGARYEGCKSNVEEMLGVFANLANVAMTGADAPKPDDPAERLQTPQVHLFNDQYIAKPPKSADARFTWHRDSQWCDEGETPGPNYKPYLSCWVALDDVDADNGAIRVLPYPKASQVVGHVARAREYEHSADELNALALRRWTRMDGAPSELDDELADEFEAEWRHAFRRVKTMTMRAGDVLFMSDRVLHCSGPNASDKVRRAWMPQFSSGPVVDAKGAPVAVARDMAFNIGYHRRETAWREKMDATREQRIAEREAEATRKMEAELRAKAKENAQPPEKEQPLRRQLIDELETVR